MAEKINQTDILSKIAIGISIVALAVSVYGACGHKKQHFGKGFHRDGIEHRQGDNFGEQRRGDDFNRGPQNGEHQARPGNNDRQAAKSKKQEQPNK